MSDEIYVKMTNEEYEEYKSLKQDMFATSNKKLHEYLKRSGFEEEYTSEGFNPLINKPTRATVYKKEICTVKIEVELL